MGRGGFVLNATHKSSIWRMRGKGLKNTQIATAIDCSRRTVERVLKERNSGAAPKKLGRPGKLCAVELCKDIVNHAKERSGVGNGSCSWRTFLAATKKKKWKSTGLRHLKKLVSGAPIKLRPVWKKAQKKIPRRRGDLEKRVAFCSKEKNLLRQKNVVFLDETSFVLRKTGSDIRLEKNVGSFYAAVDGKARNRARRNKQGWSDLSKMKTGRRLHFLTCIKCRGMKGDLSDFWKFSQRDVFPEPVLEKISGRFLPMKVTLLQNTHLLC